jgi:hypothetical protein
MTGSAVKRWTLYEDCFSERIYLNRDGGPGGGRLKIRPGGKDSDDGKRFQAMDVVLALLLGENLLE